ncbi:transmembrane protein [Mycobacterium tuberculosis CAS/NITR204]|uniref:Transmembrane protein n=1 Tax=Mycobacterium tuberculosis CAS/NITR204 TaxID=1310114 RepID=R4M425_MYCTX|nr:transmembrane protein [Mycobacterium tuberculosis CAS/NITR204]
MHVCGGGVRPVRELVAVPYAHCRPHALALRAMEPTQWAAVMLAAGGVVAVAAPGHTALMVVIVCIAGAVGTLAAGSWQSAQYALRRETASPTAAAALAAALLTQACH